MRKNKEITSTDTVPIQNTVRVDLKMWQHYLKWILFISILLCPFIFSYCQNKKTDNEDSISKQHYSFAQSAINIADDYLDYDITAMDAYSELKELCDSIKYLPDSNRLEDSIENEVQFELNLAFIDAFGEPVNKHYDEILGIRNDIAEMIDARKRKY